MTRRRNFEGEFGLMLDVSICSDHLDTTGICALGGEVQHFYRFIPVGQWDTARVEIDSAKCNALFRIHRDLGVKLTTYQSEGISFYAGIDLNSYFLLCCTLGLTQWRALQQIESFHEEDLRHTDPSDCLFSEQFCQQDYALLMERPRICQGCKEFYRCLGLEEEIHALRLVLQYVRLTKKDMVEYDTPMI